ncbi:MAG: hypothetical protein SPK06_07365 [Kiritimatiellia bacterium]|nr:hypothetical protein [Kiritimatiellia bacterium]
MTRQGRFATIRRTGATRHRPHRPARSLPGHPCAAQLPNAPVLMDDPDEPNARRTLIAWPRQARGERHLTLQTLTARPGVSKR